MTIQFRVLEVTDNGKREVIYSTHANDPRVAFRFGDGYVREHPNSDYVVINAITEEFVPRSATFDQARKDKEVEQMARREAGGLG